MVLSTKDLMRKRLLENQQKLQLPKKGVVDEYRP